MPIWRLVAVFAKENFQNYPNLLHWSYRDRHLSRPADNYLFAQRRDALLPEDLRPEAQGFAAITDELTELSAGGRNSIAVIGFAETHFLVQADLKPYFRYSPVLPNLVFKEQVDLIERQLLDHPPDYLLIFDQSPMTDPDVRAADVCDQIIMRLKERYKLVETVHDILVFKREQT